MKTASKIFYLGVPGQQAESIDQWVNNLPGELKSVQVSPLDRGGTVVVAMYEESNTADWGPG